MGLVYRLPSSVAGPFDAVTAWDVIEHLDDPRAALAAVRERLRPGGWLFVSSPDAGSLVGRALGRHWHYIDPEQHLHLLSMRNLGRLLAESGFDVRAMGHLGHGYKVRYVLNRLAHLGNGSRTGRMLGRTAAGLPEVLARRRVHIKLWDVMFVAACLR